MHINDILNIEPYSLHKTAKKELLNSRLKELTMMHYEKCEPYRRIMDAFGVDIAQLPSYEQIPFLPVRIFKEFDMLSCPKEEIVKTMTSSGTTGQQVSRIYLDRETSSLQTKCLTRIVTSFLGPKRIPMLILDSSAVIKNRNMFSARGAGILGFSMFGSKRCYALNEEMELDVEGVDKFLKEELLLFEFLDYFVHSLHLNHERKYRGYTVCRSHPPAAHHSGWR